VRSARIWGPWTWPVSESSPEGISTAATYFPDLFMLSMIFLYRPTGVLVKPVPKIASTTMWQWRRGWLADFKLSFEISRMARPSLLAIFALIRADPLSCDIFPRSRIFTSTPILNNWRATTSPSPPLFPFPATTRTFFLRQAGKFLPEGRDYGQAGVFHKDDVGYPHLFYGEPVDRLHVLGGSQFQQLYSPCMY